jgi:asparagine N-glycosylation enzyme membrane subunit Stt3
MFLAVLFGSFVVGFLLGALTYVRFAFQLVPPVAIALAYWVGFGWRGDDYDIGRDGLLVITGWIGTLFVVSWAAGVGLARAGRASVSREALGSPSAPENDPPAASRR